LFLWDNLKNQFPLVRGRPRVQSSLAAPSRPPKNMGFGEVGGSEYRMKPLNGGQTPDAFLGKY
jgi:hypothetical protein